MRKGLVAIAVLVVAVCLFLFLKRSDSPAPVTEHPSAQTQGSDESSTKTGTDVAATRPHWTKPVRNEASSETASASSKAIVYGAADFARGELQNIVVEDGIRLGNNAAFVPRVDPRFKLFGNFVSSETEASEPFDALSLNLQAFALDEKNEVLFEVRTRSRFNEWSEWREVSQEQMKAPITAEVPKSTAWQFRITMFANDAAGSPKVEKVSVEPMAASTQNLSANNNTK